MAASAPDRRGGPVLRHRVRRAALRARNRFDALRKRWTLRTPGRLLESPTYVPRAWEEGQSREAALAAAAAECRRTAAAVLRMVDAARDDLPPPAAKGIPLVVALCEVAADRLEEDSQIAWRLLSATARALDQLEASLAEAEPNEVGGALGVLGRTTAAAVRRALVHPDLEPRHGRLAGGAAQRGRR